MSSQQENVPAQPTYTLESLAQLKQNHSLKPPVNNIDVPVQNQEWDHIPDAQAIYLARKQREANRLQPVQNQEASFIPLTSETVNCQFELN